jgi:hypothetical protein
MEKGAGRNLRPFFVRFPDISLSGNYSDKNVSKVPQTP